MDEHSAIARGTNLPISRKQAIEVCNFLRGRSAKRAERVLLRVLDMKQAIPMKIYDYDLGHKPGIGAGSYPQKVSEHILKVLKSAMKNAEDRGLNEEKLIVENIQAHKGTTQWHYGRKGRRQMKLTHIEVIVREKA